MNPIESISPILTVADMTRSLDFYVDTLGFRNADWGDDHFTSVTRDGCTILLRRGEEDEPSRVYIGIEDARAEFEELAPKGVKVVMEPTNKPYALEITIEDPDGNILRFGSEPEE